MKLLCPELLRLLLLVVCLHTPGAEDRVDPPPDRGVRSCDRTLPWLSDGETMCAAARIVRTGVSLGANMRLADAGS